MEFAAALASLGHALTVVKTIKDIDQAFDRATYKAQIADLMSSIADVRIALLDAQEGAAALEAENARLKAAFSDQAELVAGPGGYKFKVDDGGEPIGYPVCPTCEQGNGRIVQLVQQGSLLQAACPMCKSVFRPVECFLPPDVNGRRTTVRELREEADQRRRERNSASIRRSGSWLA